MRSIVIKNDELLNGPVTVYEDGRLVRSWVDSDKVMWRINDGKFEYSTSEFGGMWHDVVEVRPAECFIAHTVVKWITDIHFYNVIDSHLEDES